MNEKKKKGEKERTSFKEEYKKKDMVKQNAMHEEVFSEPELHMNEQKHCKKMRKGQFNWKN